MVHFAQMAFGAGTHARIPADLSGQVDLLIPHVAADVILAGSYLVVLGGLIWFLRRRPDLVRDHWLLGLLIGCFLAVIAVARLADAISAWHATPELLVLSEVAGAIIIAVIVALMLPLLPNLVRLPSAEALQEANAQLRREVAAHEATLLELETARRDLETRVAERTKDLDLVTARFQAALRGAKVYVSSQDRDLRYLAVSEPMPMLAPDVRDIVGHTDDEVLPPESRAEIIALKRQALTTGTGAGAEVTIGSGQQTLRYDFYVEPLRDATGAVLGVTCAAVDITERRKSEEHLRLLLRELTHRSKNLLAVIQAMARQTARHAGSTEAFLEQFGARLQALATSHDLLVRESWHGVSLQELIRSQLGPYLNSGKPRVAISGDSVLLKPDVAQSLGLALHELTANAEKFGALSVPDGRISIHWRRVPQSDGEAVELLWTEADGPEVAPRARRGFGTLVLEGNLPRSLDAEVELAFPREGVRCRIIIPASRLSIVEDARPPSV